MKKIRREGDWVLPSCDVCGREGGLWVKLPEKIENFAPWLPAKCADCLAGERP